MFFKHLQLFLYPTKLNISKFNINKVDRSTFATVFQLDQSIDCQIMIKHVQYFEIQHKKTIVQHLQHLLNLTNHSYQTN